MVARDLVIFALGPVQAFIATARRTQDLWMGSQLLSLLALAGVGGRRRVHMEPICFILYSSNSGLAAKHSQPLRRRRASRAGRGRWTQYRRGRRESLERLRQSSA